MRMRRLSGVTHDMSSEIAGAFVTASAASWASMRDYPYPVREPFADDGSKNAPAVTNRAEIARPADPWRLEACNLDDLQSIFHRSDIQECLNFEPVALALEKRHVTPPERDIPVA